MIIKKMLVYQRNLLSNPHLVSHLRATLPTLSPDQLEQLLSLFTQYYNIINQLSS